MICFVSAFWGPGKECIHEFFFINSSEYDDYSGKQLMLSHIAPEIKMAQENTGKSDSDGLPCHHVPVFNAI